MKDKKKDIDTITEESEDLDETTAKIFFAPSEDEIEYDLELAGLLDQIDTDCSVLFK